MSDAPDTGSIASNVTSNADEAVRAVTGASYAVGAADCIASVEKL